MNFGDVIYKEFLDDLYTRGHSFTKQNYKFDFICDLRITEYNNFFFDQSIKKIKMVQMGFEPTPPKRLELESSALDRSAIQACSPR